MMKDEFEEMKAECMGFSKARINLNLIFVKLIIILSKPTILWVKDLICWLIIPFIFAMFNFFQITPLISLFFITTHLIYWKITAEKDAMKFIDELNKLNLKKMYEVLKTVKEEKYGKR